MANSTHAEFVIESREHLQVFERSMLALERADSQQRAQCIDAGFRAVHSLKGNAGFLGFAAIQRLAHATESALEKYRTTKESLPVFVVEMMLQAMDRLSVMVDDLDNCDSLEIVTLLEQLWALDTNTASQRSSSIRIPLDPSSKGILELVHSLTKFAGVSRLSLDFIDFREPVSNWQEPPKLACELASPQSFFEMQRILGPNVSIEALGGIELSAFPSVLQAYIAGSIQSGVGTLAYEPQDFSVGTPKPPIVWITNSAELKLDAPLAQASSVARSDTLPIPTTNNASLKNDDEPKRAEGIPPNGQSTSPQLATTQPTPRATESRPRAHESSSPTIEPSLPAQESRISSLRIQVDLLDRLMNLVGELTLVRNQSLLAFGDTDGNPRAIIQRLDSVTSELQDAVLKTRMQPVGNLFGRFPRMVRDLGRQLGKQIELELVGQEVELDKTVLEQLSDPLTHLIRNSADHGLETPEVRQRSGKSPTGKITLSAMAADGQVIIEIRDDGRGIDPEAIRNKLIFMGLKTEAELQRISTKELYSFILLPGFSTAKQVSDVSGRGVGMDVVKTNIERLEGSLSLDSSPGMGTSMVMRVPLTLAIVPCLVVLVGEQRFVVPQRGLEEIVCLYPGGGFRIEQAYDTEFFRLRDLLLPVVRFNEVLKQPTRFNAKTKSDVLARNAPVKSDPNRIEYILVLRSNGKKFGLLVDDVRGTEEIVVKPMHPSLKKLGIFAGATLMGDGRVALIANIDGIAEHADCLGLEIQTAVNVGMRDPAEVHRILLFEYGPDEQFALPLVQVRRIESIKMERIERVGRQEFISIDGVSTRIVRLAEFLKVSDCADMTEMHLLLPKFVDEPMGILVSRIVDTDSLAIELQEANVDDPGILGTAIIRGKLSLFVDTQFLREKIFGDSIGSQTANTVFSPTKNDGGEIIKNLTSSTTPHTIAKRVLLVDDTPFFREVVKRYFERIGLSVQTAIDGEDGLSKLNEEVFDLVVSDIEMPNMNGWEFCKQARERGFQTPFLALTSLSKSENASKAHDCGFDMYEEKLDHDRLVQAVRELLGMQTGGLA